MKRKHLLSLLLATALAVAFSVSALASGGDGNIDGSGGGGMGGGHQGNYWNGEDGVRISVLRTNGTKVATFDWANINQSSVQVSFGKRNKMEYKSGYTLSLDRCEYSAKVPSTALPRIVSTNGRNNIEAIKQYFLDDGTLSSVAYESGISYDDLVGGDYKLLLEPIAYYVFDGLKYAATATETALLDVQMNGQVYYWLRSLTHQNLPLAMFLEKNDEGLGLWKWTGATTGKQTNLDIINYLGMGIVSFQEPPPEEIQSEHDYVFHCDTDVIVSFPVYSYYTFTPSDNATVKLNIDGTTYTQEFCCPAAKTQLVWVRWHTPSTPKELTMTAEVQYPLADASMAKRLRNDMKVTVNVRVELLEENPPPDPTYYDKNSGFTLPEVPDYGNNPSVTWSRWNPEWVSLPFGGYWKFVQQTYTARLNVTFHILPDARCKTDYRSPRYGTVMGSGYGVQADVSATVVRGDNVDRADVTPVQNVIATFPEFGYQTYNRFLELDYGAKFCFKRNRCSHHSSRIHFTPLWYPDDTYYPVAFQAIDCWTPGGQLYMSGSDAVYICQSCLDDWYIHNIK